MKKKFLVFGFIASSLFGFAQALPSKPRKKISKSAINLVYSTYLQQGNHSAVTGGIGTEKLHVYSQEINIDRQVDSLNSYSINIGMDLVSSASTDKIDFVVSSASSRDLHFSMSSGYERKSESRRHSYGGAAYFSIESDYLSGGLFFSGNGTSKDHLSEYGAEIQLFFDDLRWGRLNGVRPLHLVIPYELRNREWYDEYRRRSINLNLNLHRVINKKMVLGIFPGLIYQQGLLATPFHRVYFNNDSLRTEKLPSRRLRLPVGVQLNSFLGSRYILRNYYRFYWDDFDIVAHTFSTELSVKLSPRVIITPQLRLYTQSGTPYFHAYKEHSPTQQFYTSDYDLSAFSSIEAGVETRFSGLGKGLQNPTLNNLSLKYAYYKRSDQLNAHIITLLFDFQSLRSNNPRRKLK